MGKYVTVTAKVPKEHNSLLTPQNIIHQRRQETSISVLDSNTPVKLIVNETGSKEARKALNPHLSQ